MFGLRLGKMNFQCKLNCVDKYFASNTEAIEHLKKIHKIKEKKNLIGCTVRNSNCGKYFQTFLGLSRHVAKCSIQFEIENEPESPEDSVCVSENGANIQNSYIFNVTEDGMDLSSTSESNPTNNHKNSFIFDEAAGRRQENSLVVNEAAEGRQETSYVFNSSKSDSITCDEVTQTFLMGLLSLNMNEKTMNDLFRLTDTLLKQTHQICQKSMTEKSGNPLESLDSSMSLIRNNIQKFDSSYKRKQFFESLPSFIKPKQVGIGTHWENKREQNSQFRLPVRKQSSFSMISPLAIIKSLFEKPHFHETYFTYNQKTKHVCEPNVYQDYCCGSVYKKTDLFQRHPNSLQLQFFLDAFELCHALKSKTGLHSQLAVYMSIRNMPPEFAYCMNNIFVICLVNENDLKKAETNYTNVLEQLVREIKILETNGIDIGNGINLKGTMVNLAFDNLGGNFALGFAQSFAATYFCRMCLCSKEETKILTSPSPEKYRASSNYQEAIQIIENSSEVNLKETKGVAAYCVLNDLKYFDILQNWTADIMHDLCEGAIKYLLQTYFNVGIKNKIFSEVEIKNMVSNYHGFGSLYSQSIPSEVKLKTKNLNQSASQMKCLFQHIPFIFHSYRDHPKLADLWVCINTMLIILRIVYSSIICEQNLTELALAIKCHLEHLKKIGMKLKPKHHLMLHYPEIIRRSGPLCHMSTLRYEMKHKSLTSTMKNNNNFTSVTKSIVEKYLRKNTFQEVYIDQIKHSKLREIEHNFLMRYKNLFERFENSPCIQSTKNIRFNSNFYEKGLILKHNMDYLEIENILFIDKSLYFVCRKYDRIKFDAFLVSLEIKPSTPEEYTLIKHCDLVFKKTHEKKFIGKQIYILCDSLDVK